MKVVVVHSLLLRHLLTSLGVRRGWLLHLLETGLGRPRSFRGLEQVIVARCVVVSAGAAAVAALVAQHLLKRVNLLRRLLLILGAKTTDTTGSLATRRSGGPRQATRIDQVVMVRRREEASSQVLIRRALQISPSCPSHIYTKATLTASRPLNTPKYIIRSLILH